MTKTAPTFKIVFAARLILFSAQRTTRPAKGSIVDQAVLLAVWGAMRSSDRVGVAILKYDSGYGCRVLFANRTFAGLTGHSAESLQRHPSLAALLNSTLERDRELAKGDVYLSPVTWRLNGLTSLTIRVPFVSADQQYCELAIELPALADWPGLPF